MHHGLIFYRRYSEAFLKFYLLGAKLTRLPLFGSLVRTVANKYGNGVHASYVLTLQEAKQIVDLSEDLAVAPCKCRQVSHNCKNPAQAEIVIGLGTKVRSVADRDKYKKITAQEAKALLDFCHEQRLVQAIMKCGEHAYAICNCCRCCCVPTRLRKEYGIRGALVRRKDVVGMFQELAHKVS